MHQATRQAGSAFADLICADPQWLRAEFDALIAASFGPPPAQPPAAPPRIPPRRGPWWPHSPAPRDRPFPAIPLLAATTPATGRQRSPPP